MACERLGTARVVQALLRGSRVWQHAFGDERSMLRDGSDQLRGNRVSLARNTAATLALDYEGVFTSGLSAHGASLKVPLDC